MFNISISLGEKPTKKKDILYWENKKIDVYMFSFFKS